MAETKGSEFSKIIISKSEATYLPDRASTGSVSRWLQSDNVRMRVIVYPPGHVGDHVCYKGHAIYVVSGIYKMEVGTETVEWKEGDAFIIPDGVPHRSSNPGSQEAKIIIFDNHV